jgi:HSP20 family protein
MMSEHNPQRTPHVVRTIPGTPLAAIHHDVFQPPTDVYETDSEIIVKVDIAGVEDDNMEVTIDDGILRVHGYRTDCSAFSKLAVHRMEIACGEFDTHVHLPHAIDTDAELDCTYRQGMLTIVLPKRMAHKVQITTE